MSVLHAPLLGSLPAQALPGAWARMKQALGGLAQTQAPILLVGGSRDDCAAAARLIHTQSQRADLPFVLARCGLYRGAILERRFFGGCSSHRRAHVRLQEDEAGHLQKADGGTLYIEQIQHATPLMQDRLLRVLQGRAFVNPLTQEGCELNVRVVAMASVDVEACVKAGRMLPELAELLALNTVEVPRNLVPAAQSHWAVAV